MWIDMIYSVQRLCLAVCGVRGSCVVLGTCVRDDVHDWRNTWLPTNRLWAACAVHASSSHPRCFQLSTLHLHHRLTTDERRAQPRGADAATQDFTVWRAHTVCLRVRVSMRLYDILGGITSPCLRTPWLVPWVAGLKKSRTKGISIDINRNRISANENTQNLETNVQIVTPKTVFTSKISRMWVSCSQVINSSNVGIKASLLLSAYWRRRCPSQLCYHPRCPHPRNNRNHPSCPTTVHAGWWWHNVIKVVYTT